MKTIEDMLRDGADKLAAKRELDRRSAEEKERKKQDAQREFWMKARSSLAQQIPAELVALSNLPWDGEIESWPKVHVDVPGCVPIYFDVCIDGNGAHVSSRFVVPGVQSYDPFIGDEDLDLPDHLCAGEVKLIAYEDARTDPGKARTVFEDLEVALALASERGAYVQERKETIEAKYAELQLQVQNQKEAALSLGNPDCEAVYTPMEEDRPAELLNRGELVAFVRGVTMEVLAERGL